MWPVNSIDDKYQSKNLSSMINLHIAENAITTHKQKNSEEKMKKQEDEDLEKENGPVGILLSAKALVQLVLNPIVGIWTTKVGYSVPIFFGSVNLLIASLCESKIK